MFVVPASKTPRETCFILFQMIHEFAEPKALTKLHSSVSYFDTATTRSETVRLFGFLKCCANGCQFETNCNYAVQCCKAGAINCSSRESK